MLKASTNSLPSPLNLYLKKVDNVHNCTTCSSIHKNYFLPCFKTKKTQRSIKFQGVSIWNKIDLDIRKLHYKIFCNKEQENSIAKILLKKKYTNSFSATTCFVTVTLKVVFVAYSFFFFLSFSCFLEL